MSMITPLGWLERVPTYKEKRELLQERGGADEVISYGLLGYPVLQAADIMAYRANAVPVGKDPSENPVVRNWGEKPEVKGGLDHVALGTKLKLFDLERAAKCERCGHQGGRLEHPTRGSGASIDADAMFPVEMMRVEARTTVSVEAHEDVCQRTITAEPMEGRGAS